MIQLLPDDDQMQIVDAVNKFAANEFPLSRLAAENDASGELARWQEVAEMGYLTLGLEEDAGGAGFSLAEEVLVFRELGRSLFSPSSIATAIAAHALAQVADHDRLCQICGGEVRAALALTNSAGELIVLEGQSADLVVVRSAEGIAIFEPSSLAEFVQGKPLDDSVSLHRAGITGSPLLSSSDEALARRTQLLASAMLVGIAEQARDMAVDYAKERVQFGKPIGSFQAIKHRCADMALHSEMAFAQLLFATVKERDCDPSAAFHTSAACLLAERAALENSAASIQIHGGIGFTAEYEAHWLLKRSRLLTSVVGGVAQQQATLLVHAFPS